MLQKISSKLASLLVEKNQSQLKYSKAVYQYGFELLLSNLFGWICILIISSFTNGFGRGLFFIIVYGFLRAVCGGYHAATYRNCFVISMITYGAVVLVFWLTISAYLPIAIVHILCVLASIYILMKAPVLCDRQKLSEKRVIRNKKMSKVFLVLECILIIILYSLKYNALALCAQEGILLAALLMIIEEYRKHRKGGASCLY